MSEGNSVRITLSCGRRIHLEELCQYQTYCGLLEGLPTKRLNRELVSSAQEHAKKKLWSPGTPFLIQPVETPLEVPEEMRFRHEEDWQPAKIPEIACLAEFTSYRPAKNPEEHLSYLSVVWFQNAFALPIDPSVEEQIRSIDWNAVATDASY
ncbi:MAG: hypothetical protein ACLP9L_01895 [Thermoguttaceae bacterium]